MKISERIGLLLLLVTTFALPASANNPPQPDGIFSVLLIFPIVLIGMRLANARPDPNEKRRPILNGLILTLCFLLTLAGTSVGGFGLLVILLYGVLRGGQITHRVKTARGRIVGAVVIAWVLFASLDYLVSLNSAGPSAGVMGEANAINRLRMLSTVEFEFAQSHSPSSGSGPVYATVEQLRAAGLLHNSFQLAQDRTGYRFGEIVDPSKPQFLFYAVPIRTQSSMPRWIRLMPGSSVLHWAFGLRESEATGVRSFAVDETGVIRYSVRPAPTPVTRAEAEKWQEL